LMIPVYGNSLFTIREIASYVTYL
jgi:hypothetical protein